MQSSVLIVVYLRCLYPVLAGMESVVVSFFVRDSVVSLFTFDDILLIFYGLQVRGFAQLIIWYFLVGFFADSF